MVITLSDADMARLTLIIRQETGNVIESRSFVTISSRIQSRMLILGLNSLAEYWHFFDQNEASERLAIRSIMTTHHSFFFREIAQINFFKNWLTENLKYFEDRFAKSGQALRIWSGACSRGQEVYTLAMELDFHFAGKTKLPFSFLGTDIDAACVDYSKNGVYPLNEVNQIPSQYLQKYWLKGTGEVANFAAVKSNIKKNCSFETLNLFDVDKRFPKAEFDVVFLRNVLIYLSAADVKKVVSSVETKMTTPGLFVTGLSEPVRYEGWPLVGRSPSCYVKEAKVSTSESSQKNPERSRTSVLAEAPRGKFRVLCVDDSPTILTILKKIFKEDSEFAEIVTATNGQEAAEKLKSASFDLITLDLHMPIMGGIEFLSTHYRVNQDPPCIVVSSVSRADKETATRALELGAIDYVEKPSLNNIKTSSEEILLKAKLAIQNKGSQVKGKIGSYDSSIAGKLEVALPETSLRAVVAGSENFLEIEHLLSEIQKDGQKSSTLILWKGNWNSDAWSNYTKNKFPAKIISSAGAKLSFEKSQLYVLEQAASSKINLPDSIKNLSIMVFCESVKLPISVAAKTSVQVLVDESLAEKAKISQTWNGFKVADITPATSFASLSLEFFAGVRRLAA